MRRVLLTGVLALAGLAMMPERSHAWGRDAYNSHGFTWFQSFVFRSGSYIHQHGPLYNYGPYDAPGHQMMYVKQPWHGVYIPADPNFGRGYGYGYSPVAVPAAPAGAPIAAPAPAATPRVLPAAYTGIYPAWLTNR